MDEPVTADDLSALRAELRRAVATSDEARRIVAELAAALESMIQILTLRGELAAGHLQMLERVRRHVKVAVEPSLHLDPTSDKYSMAGVEIDCASRIHLCHGRCCAYSIPLSQQDLLEGKLAWRIREPYYLPHGDDGYCSYQDRTSGGCGAYQHRPAQCRSYDCRTDARVWIDFDAGIPAPLAAGLVPIRRKPTLS
jgi:Putative zinc- or iron-chelating domain